MSREAPRTHHEALRRGFEELDAGRFEAAAGWCRQILRQAPKFAEAHFLTGLVARALNDRQTAINAFGSTTRLNPEHGAAWAQLAHLFVQAGQPNRADQALAEATRHDAGNPVVQDLVGTVFSRLGDQESACRWYGKAVHGRPENAEFLINLANGLTFLGDSHAAQQTIDTALRLSPDNPQGHWLKSGITKAVDRAHIDEMRAVLARYEHSDDMRAFLFYAMGKEFEDLEAWGEAFDAFRRGAACKRRTTSFDEEAERETYRTLTEVYTRAWFDAAADGVDDPAPIFIVGQPRTGTTLVERIITSHSAVHSAGELQQFGLSIRRQFDRAYPGRFSAELLSDAARIEPRRLAESYLEVTRGMRGGKARFVDKLPSNFLYLPLILKALPGAKVVHLVRDPIDACFPSFKQLFADAYPHSYDQAEMARHHARYHALMDTWRARFGERFFEVRYEELVTDIEPGTRRLIEFLGLAWEDACLEFHTQSGAVSTASAVQVREPAHARSVGRWKRYGDALAPMIKTLESEGVI